MTPMLKVDRYQLSQALKNLSKFAKPKQQTEAIVAFDGDAMTIDLAGMTVRASAEGTWSGEARVNVWFLLGIATGLPPGETLSISVEDGKLRISGSSTGFSAPCTWQEAGSNVIRLPMNPTFPMVLALRLSRTESEIARSGLKETVEAAEKRRDRLIAQAAMVLEPLGVRPADLRRVVDEAIARDELH